MELARPALIWLVGVLSVQEDIDQPLPREQHCAGCQPWDEIRCPIERLLIVASDPVNPVRQRIARNRNVDTAVRKFAGSFFFM